MRVLGELALLAKLCHLVLDIDLMVLFYAVYIYFITIPLIGLLLDTITHWFLNWCP